MMNAPELLAKLMSFRSLSAEVENVNAATRFLESYLSEAGLHTVLEDKDGRLILFASTQPGREADVLMNAHLDVVPAETEETYTLRDKDGWLWGRGTADDLGNCAVIAQALVRLVGKSSVGAIFSTDEEVGGSTTAEMVARGYRARKLVLVLDVGDYYAAALAQKGVLDVRLKARGKACHSAMPWEGTNAIDVLVDGYIKARALVPAVSPDDQWHDTMVAAIIKGGTVHNRVPDEAEMLINIRYTEGTDPDDLVRRIAEVSGCEATRELCCPPVFVDADTPQINDLISHFETGLGHDIRVKRLNGATDARHFVPFNVPIAMFGIPGEGVHGENERIEKAGFDAFTDVLVSYLRKQ